MNGLLPRVLFVGVMLTLFLPGPAFAHADVLDRYPEEGANLDGAPEQVRLRFNEPVEAEFSPIEVYDAAGRRVDRGDARTDPDDARVLAVGLENLAEGDYEVEYRVTSLDGHVVEGGYGFAVDGTAAREGAPEGPDRGAPETAGGSGRTVAYGFVGLGALGLLALTFLGVARAGSRKA